MNHGSTLSPKPGGCRPQEVSLFVAFKISGQRAGSMPKRCKAPFEANFVSQKFNTKSEAPLNF